MKVRELIKLLKKQDQDAEVIYQTHDQTDDETDGTIDSVTASSSEVLQNRFNGGVVVLG